ncbi:MAG: hypothetical protein GDA43_14360 [Hormoscilla sp. SP5CHS1]|nr:hypothetical protein [Hormoscilla sp. SP12CHS1]MBC6454226.1 hypothetical protein [Hormoscilla sp. SP5CHS1]
MFAITWQLAISWRVHDGQPVSLADVSRVFAVRPEDIGMGDNILDRPCQVILPREYDKIWAN